MGMDDFNWFFLRKTLQQSVEEYQGDLTSSFYKKIYLGLFGAIPSSCRITHQFTHFARPIIGYIIVIQSWNGHFILQILILLKTSGFPGKNKRI